MPSPCFVNPPLPEMFPVTCVTAPALVMSKVVVWLSWRLVATISLVPRAVDWFANSGLVPSKIKVPLTSCHAPRPVPDVTS